VTDERTEVFTGGWHEDGTEDCTAEPKVLGCWYEYTQPCIHCGTLVVEHCDEDGTANLVKPVPA
jgi:hypothetical protein